MGSCFWYKLVEFDMGISDPRWFFVLFCGQTDQRMDVQEMKAFKDGQFDSVLDKGMEHWFHRLVRSWYMIHTYFTVFTLFLELFMKWVCLPWSSFVAWCWDYAPCLQPHYFLQTVIAKDIPLWVILQACWTPWRWAVNVCIPSTKISHMGYVWRCIMFKDIM